MGSIEEPEARIGDIGESEIDEIRIARPIEDDAVLGVDDHVLEGSSLDAGQFDHAIDLMAVAV